jgi:hypothetical protein
MSLDARVKDSLERSSLIVDPDVRRELATVRRKTRRAIVRQRIGFAMLAAAAIVAAVFLGPRVLDVIRSQRQQPATHPSSSPQQIVGFYGTDLSTTDGPQIRASKLSGLWTMSVRGDGLLVLTPPVGAQGVSPLTSTYRVDGDRIVTTAFSRDLCSGIGSGVYRWQRSGASLSLTVDQDPCRIRVAILTAHAWVPR